MSVEKTRVSVTLTSPFIERIDRLVRVGIHMERQCVIREALRLYLKEQGMPLMPEEGSGW